MAPFKRKYDEIENSDSDEPSFGKQILPVADLPNDFDGKPMDGMQYLFTVRRDAKALPQFTRVTNPYEPLKSLPSDLTRQGSHPALPSTEWRELSESRWRNFRKNFNQPTIGTSLPASQRKLMPDKGDRDLWWEFFAGEPESVWNRARPSRKKNKAKRQERHDTFGQGKMRAWDDEAGEVDDLGEQDIRQSNRSVTVNASLGPTEPEPSTIATDEGEVENALKIEPQDSLPTPTGTPVPSDGMEPAITAGSLSLVTEKHTEEGSPAHTTRVPTPQLLKLIDEPTALRLLMYFTFWINQHVREPESPTYRLTDTHARWISSLLLRIDDYISADDMNLLRNLARACQAFVKAAILERSRSTVAITEASIAQERRTPKMGEQACWIIISGIVGIWGQRDLWMDVEDALASIG